MINHVEIGRAVPLGPPGKYAGACKSRQRWVSLFDGTSDHGRNQRQNSDGTSDHGRNQRQIFDGTSDHGRNQRQIFDGTSDHGGHGVMSPTLREAPYMLYMFYMVL